MGREAVVRVSPEPAGAEIYFAVIEEREKCKDGSNIHRVYRGIGEEVVGRYYVCTNCGQQFDSEDRGFVV